MCAARRGGCTRQQLQKRGALLRPTDRSTLNGESSRPPTGVAWSARGRGSAIRHDPAPRLRATWSVRRRSCSRTSKARWMSLRGGALAVTVPPRRRALRALRLQAAYWVRSRSPTIRPNRLIDRSCSTRSRSSSAKPITAGPPRLSARLDVRLTERTRQIVERLGQPRSRPVGLPAHCHAPLPRGRRPRTVASRADRRLRDPVPAHGLGLAALARQDREHDLQLDVDGCTGRRATAILLGSRGPERPRTGIHAASSSSRRVSRGRSRRSAAVAVATRELISARARTERQRRSW